MLKVMESHKLSRLVRSLNFLNRPTVRFIIFTQCLVGFLCAADANVYGIDFTRFILRDAESKDSIVDVLKPPSGIL